MLSRETFSYLEPYSLSPHASFGLENLKKRRKNRQKAKRLLTTLSTGTTGMNAAVVRRVAVWPLRLPSAPVLRAPSLGDVSKLRPVACDLLLGFGEINVSSLHLDTAIHRGQNTQQQEPDCRRNQRPQVDRLNFVHKRCNQNDCATG